MDSTSTIFRSYGQRLLPFLVLFALAFIVYANSYQHAYPLDAGHAIVDNVAIRSFNNIPAFFTDANTSSSLASNIDYRPIPLISYAINYAISGYNTWSWHLLQILLHALFAYYLFLFAREVCRRFLPGLNVGYFNFIALLPAAIFVVHPTNSGVVNYLCARTTLLEAVFLMMAFYFTLILPDKIPTVQTRYRLAIYFLYALALFTKVEAFGALAIFYFFDILQHQAISTPWRNLTSPFLSLRFYKRFAPFFLVTIGYFIVRHFVLKDYNTAARASHSTLTYFSTQITTWWFYLYHWFVPVKLVADDLTYPVFLNVLQPEVLLACFAWLLAFSYFFFNYRRAPVYFYLALAYFALLAPTSSFFPLQEMVNEHRPYIPVALASLLWSLPVGNWLFSRWYAEPTYRREFTAALLMFIAIMSNLTWQRNKVYLNDMAYWQDVVEKAPSSRAYLNYGLSLMANRRNEEAEHFLLRAHKEAPYWNTVHINLGVLFQNKGDRVKAREHYDLAVRYDSFTTLARVFRARFFLDSKEYNLALEDFLAALPTQANKFPVYNGLATTYAGLNDWQQALHYTSLMFSLDPTATEYSIVGIATPFFTAPERTQNGINYFEHLKELLPGREWIDINIKNLQSRLVGSNH
jgi:tetratricopeptide (TPR) repeat protein